MKLKDLRPCMLLDDDNWVIEYDCLFHEWTFDRYPHDVDITYGLIELSDGTMREYEVGGVKFTDREDEKKKEAIAKVKEKTLEVERALDVFHAGDEKYEDFLNYGRLSKELEELKNEI